MSSDPNPPPIPSASSKQSKPEPSFKENAQGCVGLAVIVLALYAFGPSMCGKKPESVTEADLKNPKQALEKIVAGAFSSNEGFERVSIEPTGPNGDKFFVNVSYRSKGGAWSEEDSFRMIRIEMEEAYEKILAYPQIPISEVKINAQMKLRDKFGNETWGDVFRTCIQSETLDKINRSNLKAVSFKRIWDPVFIHPIFFPFKEKANE